VIFFVDFVDFNFFSYLFDDLDVFLATLSVVSAGMMHE